MQPAVLERLVRGRIVLVVTLEDVRALDQDLAVVRDLQLHALEGLANRAEAEVVGPVAGGGSGRLGHAVALHHRHATGVEEPQDLRRDRRGARHALADVRSEQCAHVLVQLLIRLVEGRLELGRDVLTALSHLPHLNAQLDRLAELLGIGGVRRRQRVDLLEHPRHGREVGRVDLGQLGDDLLRVLGPVGERRPQVHRGELDEHGEGVCQGQEEVDAAARVDHALVDD